MIVLQMEEDIIMAFCHNCGKEIDNQAVICPHCGVQQNNPSAKDTGSIGWGVLGCCIPLVGLILFLVWKDTQPKNAKKAGLGALISVIAVVVLYVLLFVIAGVTAYSFA